MKPDVKGLCKRLRYRFARAHLILQNFSNLKRFRSKIIWKPTQSIIKKKTENYVLRQNYVLRRQKENNIVTRKWHKNKTNYSTEIPGCIHDARNKSNYANSINFLDNNIFRIVKFHS